MGGHYRIVLDMLSGCRIEVYEATTATDLPRKGETMTTQETDRKIREYLGHNGGECRVRVARDGSSVLRHGSPDPSDRGRDYWAWLGTRADVIREMRRESE